MECIWISREALYGATGTVLCNLEPLTNVFYLNLPLETIPHDSPQKEFLTTSAQGIQTRVVLAFKIVVGFRCTGKQLLENPKTFC